MSLFITNNPVDVLAGRSGYNLALRHFRVTQEMAVDVGEGFNLADILNKAFGDGQVEDFQLRAIVHLLLVEKYGYAFKSENLKTRVENVGKLPELVRGWTNIQIVITYRDLNNTVHYLNPESPEAWEELLPIPKNSHVLCYAGSIEDVSSENLEDAVSVTLAVLSGAKTRKKSAYRAKSPWKKTLDVTPPSPEDSSHLAVSDTDNEVSEVSSPAVAIKKKHKFLTAKMAVNVTNELFHNGNVEAWKRIVESYLFKYPSLDVLVWYEGERINDLNALFKWGKVKHGVPIMFSIAGENPTDISKLKKYLFEGASSRFEAFLHGTPGSILKLF